LSLGSGNRRCSGGCLGACGSWFICWTRKRVGFALGGNAAVLVCLLVLGVDTFIGAGRKEGKKEAAWPLPWNALHRPM